MILTRTEGEKGKFVGLIVPSIAQYCLMAIFLIVGSHKNIEQNDPSFFLKNMQYIYSPLETYYMIVLDILSETRKPNRNRIKKSETETGSKITKFRMVPIILNPKN